MSFFSAKMDSAQDDGTFLFLRKEVESDKNEDEWDDTELIRAFDKAVSKAKMKIKKKIKKESVLEDGELPDTLSEASSTKKKKNKNKKSKNKKKTHWLIGCPCRAIYSEDGEEYEAEIVEMIDSNWCKVKYIGYNNEEEVLLNELIPSLGRNVIELQKEMARQDSALGEGLSMESEEEVEEQNHEWCAGKPCEPSASTSKQLPKYFHPNTPRRPAMFDPSSLPPAPPIPPFALPSMKLRRGIPIPQPTGSDAQNSMLISWYMCGYYTGIYQRELMELPNSNH